MDQSDCSIGVDYVIVIPWVLGVFQTCPEGAARGLGHFVLIYPVVTMVYLFYTQNLAATEYLFIKF